MQSLLVFCYTFPWIIFIHFPIKFDHKQSCRNKTQEKCCNKYVIIVLFWFLTCDIMISLENIRYYVNWWVANQRLEFLCQTDNEQSRLGEHFENTFHYCQCCYYLINYPQKYSSIWGVEIEYNCEKLMANEMARIGGIWPMRRRTCGPITGWIWLRYSQLIFSTESQLQAAALCGTSIFSSPDATIRVDRLLIPANQRPREATE